MTKIFLFYQLSTCSKRAILRTTKKYGHPYYYRPMGKLLKRLAKENKMTIEEVYLQLQKERLWLIGETPTDF